MLDKQVDGIIATGKRIDSSLPIDPAGLPVPVVYVVTTGTPDSVTFAADDGQGAELATSWLKEAGRKRLVHITGPPPSPTVCAWKSDRSTIFASPVAAELCDHH